jgi:hypothetical protein
MISKGYHDFVLEFMPDICKNRGYEKWERLSLTEAQMQECRHCGKPFIEVKAWQAASAANKIGTSTPAPSL